MQKNTCGVLQFGTIFIIIKHKNNFIKTNTFPKMMQIVPNPKQGTLSGCFGLFFSNFMKTRIFPDM